MGGISLLEFAKVQGRYIHQVEVEFEKTRVKILKIKAKTVNPIFGGHHRQGEQSRMFVDEVVVF